MFTIEYYDQNGKKVDQPHPDPLTTARAIAKFILEDERHKRHYPHIFSIKIANSDSGEWETWQHFPGDGGLLTDGGDGKAFGGNFESFKAKYCPGGKGGYPK